MNKPKPSPDDIRETAKHAAEVRRIRKRLGLSQVGLAERLDMGRNSQGVISDWERGVTRIRSMSMAFLRTLEKYESVNPAPTADEKKS